MVNDYHKRLVELLKEYGSIKKVRKVRTAGNISICHPSKHKKAISYSPDVRYILGKDEVIFEVIETQTKEKTIADVIRSFFAPNVSQVYFVVKDEKKHDEVFEIADILLSLLADELGTKKGKLPIEATVIIIEEKLIEDKEKVFAEFVKSIVV